MTTISYRASFDATLRTKALKRKIRNNVGIYAGDKSGLYLWLAVIAVFIVVGFLIFKSAYLISANYNLDVLDQRIKKLTDTNNNLKSELTNIASLRHTERISAISSMELSKQQTYLSLIPAVFAHKTDAEAIKNQ